MSAKFFKNTFEGVYFEKQVCQRYFSKTFSIF